MLWPVNPQYSTRPQPEQLLSESILITAHFFAAVKFVKSHKKKKIGELSIKSENQRCHRPSTSGCLVKPYAGWAKDSQTQKSRGYQGRVRVFQTSGLGRSKSPQKQQFSQLSVNWVLKDRLRCRYHPDTCLKSSEVNPISRAKRHVELWRRIRSRKLLLLKQSKVRRQEIKKLQKVQILTAQQRTAEILS